MARLTNSPKQSLTFDLERRKSYSLRCDLLYETGYPVDLTGARAFFVLKHEEFDNDDTDVTNILVNSEASIPSPTDGYMLFNFQAAELDQDPGEYYYTLVLLSAAGFVTANNTALMDIASTIRGYGDLTPEGIRDMVWSKIVEAGFSAEEIMRLLAAHAAGSATGLEGSNPQFTGLDGTTIRIDGTYSGGTRTIDALNGE